MTNENAGSRPSEGRLVYVTDSQIPGRSAPGVQAARMCDAFAERGIEVTLVAPNYKPSPVNDLDLKSFYGLRHDIAIRRHPIPQDPRRRPDNWSSAARLLSYGWSLASQTFLKHADWVYGRSSMGLWTATRMRSLPSRRRRFGVYGELHDIPNREATRKLLRSLDGVVAISQGLRDEAVSQGIVAEHSIRVEHNGFDASAKRMDQKEARGVVNERWRLDPAKPLMVYVGRVDRPKGVPTLFEVAKRLPSTLMLIVGHVWDEALLEEGRGLGNVTLTGHIAPGEVFTYLDAATALLLPSTARLTYAEFMSPMKATEYMAAGRPIVASDLPSIREVLVHERNALLVAPEDAEAWVSAVRRLLADSSLAGMLADRARLDAQGMSWDERAGRVLGFLESG
jgi:glycosyltransferase involved in cell wall biosynthesis